MKRNVILGIAGGILVLGGAIVAYIKKEAIKDAVNEISDQVKKRLNKIEPDAPAADVED